ncbi:MAG: hypothetical protein EPO55_21595 [Reyranella sp.]|uniref:bestrophin-like domain n=1 Tax=Reyranella sp. TaxID=1929291 RepID=UPI0012217C0D|nr:hypothetical protein [Reyranella sp.]TAJ36530.1 MAG: hypothetical protein EPO55_21595 [Reyranella sp.]
MIPEFLEPILLLAGAYLASEIGYRLGQHCGPRDETFDKQLGMISSATFALVAFLIGFGFAGAGTRYVDRLDLVVKEANALGTAYLRADALPQPMRGELKEALRQYTANRLEILDNKGSPVALALLAKVGSQHERLWDIALRGTASNAPLMLVVLPSLNEVIDLHTTHLSAARRRIPTAIMVTLLISTALALGIASFGNGQAGRRYPILNFVYGFALAAAIWMTLDLDHPRRGTIQISIQPLVETLASMKP